MTGGSAGIGRAVARAFAARGDRVAVLARGEARLEATVKELEASGTTAIGLVADVADGDAVEEAAERAEREIGPVDVWVNNAMTSVFARFADVRPEEFARVTDVTYHGCVNGTRAALARMVPRDRGCVVQIGSALAYRGIPLQAAYCGAKHAIVGFTDSVRTELLHAGSRVALTCVHLPAVNTPQFDWVLTRLPHAPQPVPPIFQPEVAAAAVVHAADHPHREHWVTWPTVRTIAAQRVAPGVLDRVLARTGESSQQTEEPPSGGPGNLYAPVPGDWDAHGRFDDRARARSLAVDAAIARDRLLHATGLDRVAGRLADVAARVLARVS